MSTLTLHGFSASNYYNIVKLALLEKQLPFEESIVYTGAGERYRPEYLEQSPIGKVPCLQTEDGFITESRAIVDYLERKYPQNPLYPQDAFQAAKLLELTTVIDLYLELASRRVLPNVFAGKKPPDNVARDVRDVLKKGAHALTKLCNFDGFLIGDRFSAADVAGVIHFPAVRYITRAALEYDPLAEVPGLLAYVERMEQRPAVKRVRADQAANRPEFMNHIRTLYGLGA